MKLAHRFSSEPLLELRLDYASKDGRTVAGRCYLAFHSLEDGKLKKAMKVIPQLSVEEAKWFIGDNLEYLLTFSGQEDAVYQIHELFKGCGFDVRNTRGRAWRPVEVTAAAPPESELIAAPAPEGAA